MACSRSLARGMFSSSTRLHIDTAGSSFSFRFWMRTLNTPSSSRRMQLLSPEHGGLMLAADSQALPTPPPSRTTAPPVRTATVRATTQSSPSARHQGSAAVAHASGESSAGAGGSSAGSAAASSSTSCDGSGGGGGGFLLLLSDILLEAPLSPAGPAELPLSAGRPLRPSLVTDLPLSLSAQELGSRCGSSTSDATSSSSLGLCPAASQPSSNAAEDLSSFESTGGLNTLKCETWLRSSRHSTSRISASCSAKEARSSFVRLPRPRMDLPLPMPCRASGR
mmetsp:Transcript_48588/g.90960  ORF Transcript_48588/g.90960 Transcript_48588/m.90960 type:complete len:280 (+) Transcript_48588:561-1400(+)